MERQRPGLPHRSVIPAPPGRSPHRARQLRETEDLKAQIASGGGARQVKGTIASENGRCKRIYERERLSSLRGTVARPIPVQLNLCALPRWPAVEIDADVLVEEIAVAAPSHLEGRPHLGRIHPLAGKVAVGGAGHLLQEGAEVVVGN